MSYDAPANVRMMFELLDGLEVAAVEMARYLRRKYQPKPRARGGTLRPGHETALWLALAHAVRPYLRRRGEKAKLARILGVDRSRISEYFVSCRAMPDAERTMVLMLWLSKRQRGSRPAAGRRTEQAAKGAVAW